MPACLRAPSKATSNSCRRAQRNERGAFDLLVLKYQHKVVKLVARLLRDPTEAEDVAQEAFVKAYRALGSFRGDSAFYTWLYRIAVNTARNSIASRQRRPLDYEAELSESEQNNVAARLKHDDTPEATALSEEIRADRQPGDRATARRPAHRHRAARDRGPELRRNRGGHGLPGGHGPVADLPGPRSHRPRPETPARLNPSAENDMTDQIREQLSALLDGELPRDEMGLLVRRLEKDPGVAPRLRLLRADRRNAARPRRPDRHASVRGARQRRHRRGPGPGREDLRGTPGRHASRCRSTSRSGSGRWCVRRLPPARPSSAVLLFRPDVDARCRSVASHAGQCRFAMSASPTPAQSQRLAGYMVAHSQFSTPMVRRNVLVEPARRRSGHHARLLRDGRGSLNESMRDAAPRSASLPACWRSRRTRRTMRRRRAWLERMSRGARHTQLRRPVHPLDRSPGRDDAHRAPGREGQERRAAGVARRQRPRNRAHARARCTPTCRTAASCWSSRAATKARCSRRCRPRVPQLDRYYEIAVGRRAAACWAARCASSTCGPRDIYRYGYRLWLDEETAMPLQSVVTNGVGRPIELIHFTQLAHEGQDSGPTTSSRRSMPPASSGCAPAASSPPCRSCRPTAAGGRCACRRGSGSWPAGCRRSPARRCRPST